MDCTKTAEKYDLYGKEAITDWLLGYYNVVKILMPLKNKIILDFGCGTGKFSRFLRDKGARVVGIDISKEMLKIAKQYDCKNIKYYQINPYDKLNFDKDFFDAVVFNFVLCDISSKAKMVSILKEVNRVLKEDALIVILISNWDKSNGREFISFKLKFVKNLKSGQQVDVILKSPKTIIKDYYWSKNDYISMLESAHFKIYTIQEPKARGSKYEWIDEKKYPPFLIISAKKL